MTTDAQYVTLTPVATRFTDGVLRWTLSSFDGGSMGQVGEASSSGLADFAAAEELLDESLGDVLVTWSDGLRRGDYVGRVTLV